MTGAGRAAASSLERGSRARWLADLLVVCACTFFILYHMRLDLLLLPTTAAGGDTASFVHLAAYLHDRLLPDGRLIGWEPGGYAGYALFQFYSLLPFALIALLGYLIPLEVAFKLVTVLGPVSFPAAAYVGMRLLGGRFPAPAAAAAATLPFLFQEGNSMWGGNILSVLSGEFSHAIGLSLWLVFTGLCNRVTEKEGRLWVFAGALLAAIGLTHAFAFIPALWAGLFYLTLPSGMSRRSRPLFKLALIAFLLMGFWSIPLLAKVKYTTQFSVEWHIKAIEEVLPRLLWIPAALAAVRVALALVLRAEWADRRVGCFLWLIAGAIVAFYAAPSIGFPDIRFIPIMQIMLCLLAADLVGKVFAKLAAPAPAIMALCALAIWSADSGIKNLPAWVKWNYEGFERKVSWPIFKAVNDFLKGSYGDPRVAYENSPQYDRFGSMRAFESLPRFSGRATLEGVLFQTPATSPFVFFLQSEISEKPSNPFPQYTYSAMNGEAATAHFKLFNVSEVIGVTDKFAAMFSSHPEYELAFKQGQIKIFRLKTAPRAYVQALSLEPVLFRTDDWKRDFFRWYKHPERLDVILSPEDHVPAADRGLFKTRGDRLAQLPRVRIMGECEVRERILSQGLWFRTTCPGRPHLVKMSYFPNWRAEGARGPFLASPAFMLVFPQKEEVRLYYGSTAADLIGQGLTALGLVLVVVLAALPVRARRRDTWVPPLLFFLERRRAMLAVAFLFLLAAATAWSVWERRQAARLSFRAHDAFNRQEYDRAIELFGRLVALDDNSPRVQNARLYLGFSYYRKKDFIQSLEVFNDFLEIYPEARQVPEVVYHIAMSEAGLGRRKAAIERFREIIEKYPDTPWATYAGQRLREMGAG